MDVYSVDETGDPYEPAVLESEEEIHGFLENRDGFRVGGVDVFLVGSELSTRTGVRPDLVGVARTGHVIILELKQSDGGRKGSRTALVQALEYAADFRSQSYQDLAREYDTFTDGAAPSLRQAHADYFDLDDPLHEIDFTKATEPRLCLLAEHFETSDIDAARYLRDVNDVDISCVQITPFEIEGNRVYAFETRLESKTAPSLVARRADEESLPWLTTRLEESYYNRFHDKFGIDEPDQATERDGYFKGNRFISAAHHPNDLRYSFKFNVFDEPPMVKYGVSPTDNERVRNIIDENRDAIGESHRFGGTKWRRIRGGEHLQDILSDANLGTRAPEVSETISRVLWNDDRFQSTWNSFLDLAEKWHDIIDADLRA